MKKIVLLFTLFFVHSWGQSNENPDLDTWVNQTYQQMSLEQRIGQLFMVAAYSNLNQAHVNSLETLVTQHQVGGLIFFQGGPVRQAHIHNRLQSLSRIPMLVGIDGEWGLAMRLDSTYRFPYNMTLGAIEDLKLIEQVGQSMAIQAKRLGMQFNFGPVVDININPKNPIIGVRSFGEQKELVASHAVAFTKGYQSENVFATAKHFPGHGDTSTDSHYSLPLIDFSKDRLYDVELYPYRKLIEQGLSSVMVAHLALPAFEPDKDLPTSLSYNVVTKLLRQEMGFEGLIFTDALNMKAAANYKAPGEVDLAAFLAGNDLLLFSENVPVGIQKIKQAYLDKQISEQRLAYSVKKILSYKYKSGLTAFTPVETQNLEADLNHSSYDDLNQKLYDKALTLLKNQQHILPIKNLEKQSIAYIKIGDDTGDTFLEDLRKFAPVEQLSLDQLDKAKDYSRVILGYHKVDNPWRNHDLKASEIDVITKLAKETKLIFVSFAKAYALSGVYSYDQVDAVVQGYQNNAFAHRSAAQLIFGTLEASGKLPVTVSKEFQSGSGLKTKKLNRLGFSTLRNKNMDPDCFIKIDSIAHDAIARKYTPGIQLVVAKGGDVVYQKSYGTHTYDSLDPVLDTDLFDLASLTKILSTTPMLMHMVDQYGLELDTPLGELVPEFAYSDKKDIPLLDVLTHQGGLFPWIGFYKNTLDSVLKPSDSLYRYAYSKEFDTQVAEHLFLKKNYTSEILQTIAQSKLLSKKEYKYSDLGFIALKQPIEQRYKMPLDQIVRQLFYAKIGATTLGYLPLRSFDTQRIVPSELDTYFRYTTLQGYVHDMTAAMQGGVSGHAGLFSNALDVAKMMQLFLNKGTYGQDHFFSAQTFDRFNTCVYCKSGNRRGVGFDKQQLKGQAGPTCRCASSSSFGHTGFTGTMAWADPEYDLVYVFLSNRTYPDASDNKLSRANVRENIQELIYQSIQP